jgi:hypothetical protein
LLQQDDQKFQRNWLVHHNMNYRKMDTNFFEIFGYLAQRAEGDNPFRGNLALLEQVARQSKNYV